MHNHHVARAGDAGRQRQGAAAVEFALVAPLFLLLLAGIVEFGQVFRIEHMLSNASRRGARAAIVEGATESQVKSLITSHCTQTLGVSAQDITVTITVNGGGAVGDDDDDDSGGVTSLSQASEGDAIQVTVSLPYAKAGVGFFANTFADSTLSASCILEHE
ncbi:TadE-like protein [Maioricimonas rarisocia]|uniref:TadE-like protein n=1 Tax=Maioricimonas rarisocia TaxID=2528026 RepID=A0A517ZCD6_9PLAN|nr:TadE/TadG family type IV pilus assembly protein [Maioricimonas rarisocia]QDU40148.1 TadE-like protein [Maioricimonas rarisocia]